MGKTIPNFKAKRKDNGQWVCGSYFALHHNDNRDHIHHFIIPNGAPIPKGTPIDKVQVEIDPDSLTLVDDSGEELLMVSRKRVQKYWAEIKKFEPTAEPFDRKAHYQGQLEALYDCFGDKCLPDMPEITDSGSGAQGTTPPSYKLDVKPKHVSTEEVCKMLGVEKDDSLVKPFRVGDKVIVVTIDYNLKDVVGGIGTITEIIPHGYHIKSPTGEWFAKESDLEPYTEESRNLSQNIANCDKSKYNPLNNMEEKELNLCELLKDCIYDTFYSPICGECEYKECFEDSEKMLFESVKEGVNGGHMSLVFDAEGKYEYHGICMLFPSKELYEKYPLDPRKAWTEWSESRKPKRWRAKEEGLYYWLGSYWNVECNEESMSEEDNALYNVGNYFRTEAEVEEMAEEILKVVNAFHKRKESDQ